MSLAVGKEDSHWGHMVEGSFWSSRGLEKGISRKESDFRSLRAKMDVGVLLTAFMIYGQW